VTDSLVSASDAFAGILAARAVADRELRRKAVTRSIAVAAVTLLHIAFFYIFVIAEEMPVVRKGTPAAELILLLAPASQPAAVPRTINANPLKKREREDELVPQPITIPPPLITTPQPPVDCDARARHRAGLRRIPLRVPQCGRAKALSSCSLETAAGSQSRNRAAAAALAWTVDRRRGRRAHASPGAAVHAGPERSLRGRGHLRQRAALSRCRL